MAIFVVDASVALAWCFEDEASRFSDSLLERIRQGNRIAVPAHWPTEISNGLLVAERRKRIKQGQAALFWDELAHLPIDIEQPLTAVQAKAVLAYCKKHGLTVYDGAYLELAHRRNLPLGTLDADLRRAAQAEGLDVLYTP
jgi:predicted nucleic acid-binding protein